MIRSPGGIRRVNPDFLQQNLRAAIDEINSASLGAEKEPIKRVVYFSGCMTDLAFAKTGKRVVGSLQKAGVEVLFPKSQVCCGAPAYYSGDMDTAVKNVQEPKDIGKTIQMIGL